MIRNRDSASALVELSRLKSAIIASGDVIYDWDLASDTINWSGGVESLFSVKPNAIPSTAEAFHSRISPEDLPTRMRALSDHLTGTQVYDCEYRVRDDIGEFQWVHDRGAVEMSPTGTPTRLFGSLRRVTIRKQREARLEYLASFDELTGHFNKLRLREAVDHALASAGRIHQTGAFLVVGIDQMGMINTAYGFEAGDAVLVAIGQRLDRCMRNSDVIGRIGGDRFGLLLGSSSDDHAMHVAERVLDVIRQMPVDLGDRQVSVTASISLVMFPTHAKTSFDIMAKAEGALLQAKAAGRDCLSLYEMTEEQRLSYRASMDVGEEVKSALKEQRLVFAYQPVVTAQMGDIEFYECLLRMRSHDGNLLPAGAFVPAVEQLGLMRTIDRRVLDIAVDLLETYPEAVLAINISGLTATDRSWLRALLARLKGRPEQASRLIVEITETAALHDVEESARFVNAVRDLGCRVAIDDFGAGYTTFRHLKSLTVDIVKIDGSFVRNITQSRENQIFLRNLLDLAQTFGLATVAEFVETAEEAEYLAKEGVDYLQGYYFGKPDSTAKWMGGQETTAALQLAKSA